MGAKVKVPNWKESDFAAHFGTLQRLEDDLKRIIHELDPNSIDWVGGRGNGFSGLCPHGIRRGSRTCRRAQTNYRGSARAPSIFYGGGVKHDRTFSSSAQNGGAERLASQRGGSRACRPICRPRK